MRHNLIVAGLGLALLACGCGGSKLPVLGKLPFVSSDDTRYLPENGAVPGLARVGKMRGYGSKDMREYLGDATAMFVQYGAQGVSTADYTLGAKDRTVTVECFLMEDDIEAAGIFHCYRGKKLRGLGSPVEAGAEGVLDRKRDGRNLYFYKQRFFFKIIYSGKDPVPDLLPLARAVAARVPGNASRPKGFEFISVDGVDATTAGVTPGFTFDCDFLPPGVIVKAPGAGDVADLFLISHLDEKSAEKSGRDYRTYLQLNGENYESRKANGRREVWMARDPVQGRVIATVYGKYLVGVVRPKTYEDAEAIINRVLEKIYADSYGKR